MHVVLVEPEIPQNTGNIARSCVATGSTLHLVEPVGFSLEDRYLRRAGMDYWRDLSLVTYPSLDDFLVRVDIGECYLASKKASQLYSEVRFPSDCYLVFGKESRGLPEPLLARYPDRAIRIPMVSGVRSLNLSSAAAVVLYEALRQNDFSGLSRDEGLMPEE